MVVLAFLALLLKRFQTASKELEALGIEFDLNTLVNSIDAENHLVSGVRSNGAVTYKYNKLIVATGAIPKVDAFQGFWQIVKLIRTLFGLILQST